MSDASTRQPLAGVSVQLFANHTPLSAETSSSDGDTYLRFPYRLGTPLVVTATKQGYVLNSVPWTPSRLPGKRSGRSECVCSSVTDRKGEMENSVVKLTNWGLMAVTHLVVFF